jgi:LmbE family N-acetylglucosaminyl deacetylase
LKLLYIFPHPDDESFGAGAGIAAQRRLGHEVHLLTLTRGGATRQRHKFGYSVEEMGEVRLTEMLAVEKTLDLSGMTVLDLPDSGLAELDPREIEVVVADRIRLLEPDVVITYAVHGISGFHDHLVTHAVVKRVFCEMRGEPGAPRRLALYTLARAKPDAPFHLSVSAPEKIDAVQETSEADRAACAAALACYTTYKETIASVGLENLTAKKVHYEIFQEDHEPWLTDLAEGL